MDKKEVINQLLSLNKLINDLRPIYTRKSEYIQGLVKKDTKALSMVEEAEKAFLSGDSHGAKQKHFEIIHYLENPIQKHKLNPKKVYVPDGNHKLLCPVLIPPIGFSKMTTDEDVERFIDRMAERGWGNFIRIFVAANWEVHWQNKNRIHLPYMKESGKFRLTKKNPEHFETLFRRADYAAERDIMPMFSLLDNCSLKTQFPGYWNTHWMNGNNNVNGTHTSPHSQTHWLDPDHEGEPGFTETKKFLLDLYDFILLEAKKRYGRFFLIEGGNEIDARIKYQVFMRDFINERLGGNNKWRIITSMCRDNFYAVKLAVIPCLHGCGDYKEYITDRKPLLKSGVYHMASQDGRQPFNTFAEAKDNVLKFLREPKNIGFEGNLRPLWEWNGKEWINVGERQDWSLRSLRTEILDGFGEAFSAYLS